MGDNLVTEVSLRPTEEADLPLLLAWRHNPQVMRYFVDGGETWEEHWRWWQSKPCSFIIRYRSRPVGEVHYTLDALPEVGIYIGETALWGKGIGREAMALLLQELRASTWRHTPYEVVVASVHPDNKPSIRMFRALGFNFERVKDDGYLLFRKHLGEVEAKS